MPATTGVLAFAFLVGLVLVVLGWIRRRPGDPGAAMDPDRAEHWLVETVDDHPRLRHLLAAGDRRMLGGAAVAASFALVVAASLAIGALFDSIDTNSGFARWDDAIARWGPEHSSSATADALAALTDLGTSKYLAALLVLVGAIDWFRRRDAGALLFLLTVGIGVSLINNALKWSIMRERPPVEHLVGSAGSSFPSGHSAAAAACWLALALVVSRWVSGRWRPFLFGGAVVIACTVAASRALLGVHWLTDVIAGLLVGWTWFFLVAIAFGGRHQRLGEPVEEIAENDEEEMAT
jgi:membrane-associated phospholipid phosphatase